MSCDNCIIIYAQTHTHTHRFAKVTEIVCIMAVARRDNAATVIALRKTIENDTVSFTPYEEKEIRRIRITKQNKSSIFDKSIGVQSDEYDELIEDLCDQYKVDQTFKRKLLKAKTYESNEVVITKIEGNCGNEVFVFGYFATCRRQHVHDVAYAIYMNNPTYHSVDGKPLDEVAVEKYYHSRAIQAFKTR